MGKRLMVMVVQRKERKTEAGMGENGLMGMGT